jgi:hypothetical protein
MPTVLSAPLPLLPPPSGPAVAPQLFWIATITRDSCLWPQHGLGEQNPVDAPRRLEQFVEAVAFAEERVLILDPHFGGDGLVAVWTALDLTAAKVPILTQRKPELDAWLIEHSLQLPEHVEARQSRHAFHDRLAVVDADLWHFGSTVGGGHHQLSAASCGWHMHAAGVATLFDAWWER